MLTMNIILVSERLPKARTITLGWPHLIASGMAMFGLVILLAGALNYGILRFAAELNIPYVRDVLVSIQRQQQEKNQSYLQDNLNAMAVRLGQMQAQLLRLETLGERLAKLAGFKPQDLMFNEVPFLRPRRRAFIDSQPESVARRFHAADRPADPSTGRPRRQTGFAGVDVHAGKRAQENDPNQAAG